MPNFSDVTYQDLTELETGKYEYCTFTSCSFEKADLSEMAFWECEFEGCNLSNADIRDTDFREVSFQNCKLLGLSFHTTKDFLFSVSFDGCQLDYASFIQKEMAGTQFTNCSLEEVDFSQATLTQAIFENCDLKRTLFERTKLEKVDFRTATGFIIDPEINSLKKARFSAMGLAGLLKKYDLDIE
ncbi:MAG: pentapeptide repeat-containing protein [Bacteroidota bacterium]